MDPLAIPKLYYAGAAIVQVMYGIFFALSVICLHYLLTHRTRNWIVIIYTVTSLLVTTIFLAASSKYTELILIEGTVNPARTAVLSSRLDLLQQVVYSVKIWLADSLLIYRLWVVWGGNYFITFVPCVLFIGSLATGIAGVALFPSEIPKHMQIVNLGVGFHTLSVALNVFATSLIAGRLLRQSRFIEGIGGSHGSQYMSLMAVFTESGALYSITGLIYIPLYATGNTLIFVFSALLEAASGIGPALILLRIALGVAVERKSQAKPSRGLNVEFSQKNTGSDVTGVLSTFHAAQTRSTLISSGTINQKGPSGEHTSLENENLVVKNETLTLHHDIEKGTLTHSEEQSQ